MIKKLILICCLFQSLHCTGQTLSPVIIASAGDYLSSGNVSLEFTIGELTMVETFSSGSSILTQGLHQTLVSAVGIDESPIGNSPIAVFPNPATSVLNISINVNEPSEFHFKMFDAQGKLTLYHNWKSHASPVSQSFDISTLTPGIYFVEILSATLSGYSQYYNQKISIVK